MQTNKCFLIITNRVKMSSPARRRQLEQYEMERLMIVEDEEEERNGGPSENTRAQQLLHGCVPYLGIVLATVSSLFFSLCSVIVKVLVDVHPMELATCRFVGVLLPVLPILIYRQEDPFPKGSRLALVARCFVGTTGLMLSFYAFRHMPLADASVVVFSVPVFVAVFARIFLKVKLKCLYIFNRKAATLSDLTKF